MYFSRDMMRCASTVPTRLPGESFVYDRTAMDDTVPHARLVAPIAGCAIAAAAASTNKQRLELMSAGLPNLTQRLQRRHRPQSSTANVHSTSHKYTHTHTHTQSTFRTQPKGCVLPRVRITGRTQPWQHRPSPRGLNRGRTGRGRGTD